MYPGFAKTARDEGFDEDRRKVARDARPPPRRSHAGRFGQGLESVK